MKIVVILLTLALLLLCVMYGSASDLIDRTPVVRFDLKRYMGTWYEIARFDHRFERYLAEVKARYRLLADGRITVENQGTDYRTEERRKARGKAHAGTIPGRLRVSFFWFFYTDYNILELGDDYEWALVGGSTSDRLWILSRTPSLPSATLNRILRLAERRGYPTGKLLYVDQSK